VNRKENFKRARTGDHYSETHYEDVRQIFLHATGNYASRCFILDKNRPADKEYVEYTYEKFGKDVVAFGTALDQMCGASGERIVIIGENQYEWYVSYVAVLIGRGVAVPVDKELPSNEIENLVNRAKASVVIYSSRLKDRIIPAADKLPTVKRFIQMKSGERSDDKDGKYIGFEAAIDDGRALIEKGDDAFLKTDLDPDGFKALFFTSGTTANSKGVMVSSRQLAGNINAVSAYVDFNETDRFFSVLPLHHTYESSIGFLLPLAYGSSIAVCQGLKYISKNLKEAEPSIMIAVPLLLEKLRKNVMRGVKQSHKEKQFFRMVQFTNALKKHGIDLKRRAFESVYDGVGGKLRIVVSAAAPLDKAVGQWYSDIGVTFLQGYGLTETSPIAAVTPDYDMRIGSAGKTVLNGKIRVDDPDEKGEGELLISTDTLMMGYYQDDAATKSAIEYDDDGRRWFRSGDVGFVDSDDFVYITGRIKNVIVTQNGKNVFPEELELLISAYEEIEDCMVYGKSADGGNELTVTCRVMPDYAKIKELYGEKNIDEIRDIIWNRIREVNGKVPAYKAVKSLEIKDGDFIKTTTQKIKRYVEINEGKVLAI